MRTSRFRPSFDRLDARIVLDATAVTGVPLAATVLAATSVSNLPGANDPIVPDTGWFLGGTPPSQTEDPMNPPLPIEFQTATSMATN